MSIIKKCRSCKSESIINFFDLGIQPFANGLLDDKEKIEKKYPLAIFFCPSCSLVQLNYTASAEELFSQYFWVSSTSSVTVNYADEFYEKISNRLSGTPEDSYILEVASNDGTFLKVFKNNNHNIIGVDPAKNIAKLANDNGIPTYNDFFGKKVAEKIIEEKGKPKVVFARNVLPHVSDIHDFISGLKTCMSEDSLLVLEVHYAGKILEELHYDSIYHEHIFYYTLESLNNLLLQYDLFMFDIEKSPISGGSIVLYIRNEKREFSKKLEEMFNYEIDNRYNKIEKWQEFANRAIEHKNNLNKLINSNLLNNKKIIGYGASARSSTLLNYCNINNQHLDSIADKNSMKNGYFSPGTHIKIKSPKESLEENPDVVLLLAWNFKDEIINELRNKHNFTGKVIVPLPEVEII
jgi:hypothetical protein